MLVEPGKLDANLGRATEMIRDAAEQGCDVVVLPEYLDLGWTHASAADLARPVPGPTTHVLAEAARANGIYVAAGMTERAGSRRYNAAVLVSPAGQLLLHHRKINEVGPGRAVYATGRRLKVVETELGAIGLAVCADTLPPALAIGRALGLIGASRVVGPTGQVLLRGPYGVGAAALLTVDV